MSLSTPSVVVSNPLPVTQADQQRRQTDGWYVVLRSFETHTLQSISCSYLACFTAVLLSTWRHLNVPGTGTRYHALSGTTRITLVRFRVVLLSKCCRPQGSTKKKQPLRNTGSYQHDIIHGMLYSIPYTRVPGTRTGVLSIVSSVPTELTLEISCF